MAWWETQTLRTGESASLNGQNGQITHENSMGKLPMGKMGKLPMETQWANYPWVKLATYPKWVNQRTKWVASIAKPLRLIIAKITMKSPEKDLTSP